MRTFIIIILFFCFSSCNSKRDISGNKKNYFEIVKKGGTSSIKFIVNPDTIGGEYKFYKKAIDYSEEEKLQMIGELLNYKGSKEIASFHLSNSNKNLSQFYTGDTENYSVEIQALLLINQIYFTNPFYYSPYPILTDLNLGLEINYNNGALLDVYSEYENWYEKVNKNGFQDSKNKNLVPLSPESEYRWIYGVWVDPNSELQFELIESQDIIKRIKNQDDNSPR